MKQLSNVTLTCAIAIISISANGQSTSLFKAKLVDYKTKLSVANARIILAKKAKDKRECVINTLLTAVSKENGEVLITNVPVGDYVIFYNMSGKIDGQLNNKVINYDPANDGGPGIAYLQHISQSFGCSIKNMIEANLKIIDGNALVDGFFYAEKFDLAMISKEGKLFQVDIPSNKEISVELFTEIGKK